MVDLEYYQIDEASGLKTKLNNAMSFGNMFKGTRQLIPITVYNNGDTPAVSPTVSIAEYPGGNNAESYKWKKISFSKTDGFTTSLKLPDIEPKSWLKGKDVVMEDFNNYPVIAGTKPDQTWLLWEGTNFGWEVYNGWLQHNVDTIDGRALWTSLYTAKDFEFSMRVTVRDNVYAGCILRDEGDSNTGYIVLVQGMQSQLGDIAKTEGVIQVFSGKFTEGMGAWKQLYKSPSIGIRGTHDYFKVRLKGNRFDFWYKNEDSDTPLYSFIDENETHTRASKPVIVCHAGFGSVLTYFDDVKMEVENDDGVIWIENSVDGKTSLFGAQYSLLNMEYGGVE